MPYHHYTFAFTNSGPGGGSRILWFILGGIATALWIKGRERHNLIKDSRRAALPPPGPFITPDSVQLRERLARMNVETSEAAVDVADATLDAALRIVGALKSTLAEHRAETEKMKTQAMPQTHQTHTAGTSLRSASPGFMAGFHHVEATS